MDVEASEVGAGVATVGDDVMAGVGDDLGDGDVVGSIGHHKPSSRTRNRRQLQFAQVISV